jgi:hypothetical protein
MSYKEIPNHRLLPRTVIEQYCNGLGYQEDKDSYPLELIADYEYYTEKPHMLSQYVVKKWYEQGLLNSYAEHANLELVNRR